MEGGEGWVGNMVRRGIIERQHFRERDDWVGPKVGGGGCSRSSGGCMRRRSTALLYIMLGKKGPMERMAWNQGWKGDYGVGAMEGRIGWG